MRSLQIKERARENRKSLLALQIVMVIAVLTSILGAFLSVFDIDVSLVWVFPISVVVGSLSAVLVWKWKRKLFFPISVFVIVLAVILYKQISEGIAVCWNVGIKIYNDFYVTHFPVNEVETTLFAKLTVLILISFLFAIPLSIVLKKKKGLLCAILCVIFPIAISAYLGELPQTIWFLSLVCTGCFYVLLYYNDYEKVQKKEWTLIAIILIFTIGVSMVIEPLITNYKLENIEAYREIKNKLVDFQIDAKSQIGTSGSGSSGMGGGISDGDLSGELSFKPIGKNMIEVTMTRRPAGTVYLRGFVGATYEGDRWEEVDRKELSDVIPILGGSAAAREIQNEPYRRVIEGMENRNPYHMELELLGAAKKYGYEPYCANITKDHKVYLDSYVKGGWSKKRSYDYYFSSIYMKQAESSDLWKEYAEVVKKAYTNEYPQLSRLREYMDKMDEDLERVGIYDSQGVYDAYTSSYYTDTYYDYQADGMHNSKINVLIRSLFMGFNLYLSSSYWQTGLYTYNRTPDQIPEGEDFVEEFLLKTRNGFCVHYATAATVLYQMYGVPARYVEGYAIDQDSIKPTKDGTYKAIVTDKDAHAWCEVFDPYGMGLGWTVIDHTPSERDEVVDDTQEDVDSNQTQTDDTPDEPQREDDNQQEEPDEPEDPVDDTTGDEVQDNMEDVSKNDLLSSEEVKWLNTLKMGVFYVGLPIAGAAVFFGVVVLQRKIRRKKKKLQFKETEENKGILKIYKEIYEICLFAGFKAEGETEKNHVEKMAEMFPKISKEEWNWTYDVAERAAFSGEIFSKAEQRKLYHFYQRLRNGVMRDLKWVQKMWFLYGRAL